MKINLFLEEVKATIANSTTLGDNDLHLWKQAMKGEIVLDESNYPELRVLFDIAWQQRSSGNRYNLQSGQMHSLLEGTRESLLQ
jgi:hypothetical protein